MENDGWDLGFGFDADVEGGDPGGEDTGEAFAGERVEKVEARLGEAVEATPLLDHADAGLSNATTEEAERVPHPCKPPNNNHLLLFLLLCC